MARVGIVESSVPVGKYFSSASVCKENSVFVVNLSKEFEFALDTEIL
jgi:hypothetical protein